MGKENLGLMVAAIYFKENKKFILNSAFKKQKKGFIRVKISRSQVQ
jgi:hypothetical protein